MGKDMKQRIFNAFYDCNEVLLHDEIENFLNALDKQGLIITEKSGNSQQEDCHGLDDN
jgi:hypothetical protein